ncbi:uncharacterized protein DFL_003720 [Arthrobotrys flagrans]|uniref:Uncharacterized protein n=1 Tax=Arthrobotrys flagrans TaxID=97331 RepID=A0A437A2M6_ARTFL|nr:hypothetical protein DFL_003720 [Arthrobotrys flagrans]
MREGIGLKILGNSNYRIKTLPKRIEPSRPEFVTIPEGQLPKITPTHRAKKSLVKEPQLLDLYVVSDIKTEWIQPQDTLGSTASAAEESTPENVNATTWAIIAPGFAAVL